MPETCCVEGCDKSKTKKDVTFFRFPNSRTLRRKWLDAISSSEKVSLEAVVCSAHFLEEQYMVVRGKRRLKPKMVPIIFEKINNTNAPETKDCTDRLHSIDNADKEEHKSPEHRQDESMKNGEFNAVDMVKRIRSDQDSSIADIDSNKDIEDIITNYQIKQIRPLNREIEKETNRNKETQEETLKNREIQGKGDAQVNNRANLIEIEIPGSRVSNGIEENKKTREEGVIADEEVIDLDEVADPVFIEVSVGKGGEVQEASQDHQDCLMLLESVQCEVDPSSLMLEPDPGPVDDGDSDVVDLGEKKENPISLLTSSDEDEVILQEPKYDTVEVSDETDEDDVPLVKLIDMPKTEKTKKKKSNADKRNTPSPTTMTKILWGQLYEYYCMECHFKTTSKAEFKKHKNTHTTGLHVCDTCSYTTASKQQFVRHQRKHREEKTYRCHLCKYKARHNMSLIYHLKSHNPEVLKKCFKCNFETDTKSNLMEHVQACCALSKQFLCDKCNYETDRRSSMKRHNATKH